MARLTPTDAIGNAYCNICNSNPTPRRSWGDPAQRTAHIKDATDFFAAVENDSLPAVFVCQARRAARRSSGHRQSLNLFEGMLQKIVDNPRRQSRVEGAENGAHHHL